MMFSKKYKYRSIVKKKTNKFFFFFNFFSFLFQRKFFFLVFQKKMNLLEFISDRKIISKKGFILKKISSTHFRYILKKYKPFFKGFISLAFDFHFVVYEKVKSKKIEKINEFKTIFESKSMLEKYQILFFNFKGRFYSYSFLEIIIRTNINNFTKYKNCFFNNIIKFFYFLKKIYIFFLAKRFDLRKERWQDIINF